MNTKILVLQNLVSAKGNFAASRCALVEVSIETESKERTITLFLFLQVLCVGFRCVNKSSHQQKQVFVFISHTHRQQQHC